MEFVRLGVADVAADLCVASRLGHDESHENQQQSGQGAAAGASAAPGMAARSTATAISRSTLTVLYIRYLNSR